MEIVGIEIPAGVKENTRVAFQLFREGVSP